MPHDDDDAILDWGPDAATAIDHPVLPEADTAKFRSLEWATGREAGFSEGVDRALAAFEFELARAGFSEKERTPSVRRVRDAALRRG